MTDEQTPTIESVREKIEAAKQLHADAVASFDRIMASHRQSGTDVVANDAKIVRALFDASLESIENMENALAAMTAGGSEK